MVGLFQEAESEDRYHLHGWARVYPPISTFCSFSRVSLEFLSFSRQAVPL